MTADQAKALSLTTLMLTDGDTVTVSGAADAIAGLSAAQIRALGDKGVDFFEVSW